jgi:hypothetical protein
MPRRNRPPKRKARETHSASTPSRTDRDNTQSLPEWHNPWWGGGSKVATADVGWLRGTDRVKKSELGEPSFPHSNAPGDGPESCR